MQLLVEKFLRNSNMKCLVIFAAVLLTVSAFSEYEQWTSFKLTHQKSYSNVAEEKKRFAIFKSNLKEIAEHNAKYERGEVSYYLGVTQFADMTSEEFSNIFLHQMSQKPYHEGKSKDFSGIKVSESVDWREKNIVSEVKNQGNCGSCWAFSTTGSLESQSRLINNISISLSEQELVDCAVVYENYGCGGGLMDNGFQYIRSKGIASEESYPYEGVDHLCRRNRSNIVIKVKDYQIVKASEESLKSAVGSAGPISVAIYAMNDLKVYAGGIYDNSKCVNNDSFLNHGVLVIGYGSDNGKDYWLLKNSWGKNWGDNGFFKLGRNPSVCGIYLKASYPILEPR